MSLTHVWILRLPQKKNVWRNMQLFSIRFRLPQQVTQTCRNKNIYGMNSEINTQTRTGKVVGSTGTKTWSDQVIILEKDLEVSWRTSQVVTEVLTSCASIGSEMHIFTFYLNKNGEKSMSFKIYLKYQQWKCSFCRITNFTIVRCWIPGVTFSFQWQTESFCTLILMMQQFCGGSYRWRKSQWSG